MQIGRYASLNFSTKIFQTVSLTLCSSNCLVLLAVHRGHHFKFTFAVEWPRSEQGSIYTISDFLQSNNIIMQLPLQMRFSSLVSSSQGVLVEKIGFMVNFQVQSAVLAPCMGQNSLYIVEQWANSSGFVCFQEKLDELAQMGRELLRDRSSLRLIFPVKTVVQTCQL